MDDDLVQLWLTRLRNDGKRPGTIRIYGGILRGYPGELTRAAAEKWTARALDAGTAPGTARLRVAVLRGFSAYLAEETGEPHALAGLKLPKLGRVVVPKLAPDELTRLLAACSGKKYADRRDLACVRLMAFSGLRAGEVCSLTLDALNLTAGTALVNGKGGKQRIVPFGGLTAESLGWYLRVRRTHRCAKTSPRLWLGDHGRESFTYSGLYKALDRRAKTADICSFHPHRLRHTFASEWLRRGGSEGGLMSVAGWSTRDMIDVYVSDTRAEQAIQESRRLGLD